LQGARHIYRRLGRKLCLAELRRIVGEADAERPLHGVRYSLGLQPPPVRVPGRLHHLTVEIASARPFLPYMIGVGSSYETERLGFSAKLRELTTSSIVP
jgi:hypothetical protein